MNLSWVSSEPFNPATYYSEALARHRRLRTPERRQDAPPVTKPVVVVMNEREGMEIAVPKVSRPARAEDSNAHVLAWLQYWTSEQAEVPYPAYIKLRCKQLGVSYADVCSRARAKDVIAAKHLIMSEVHNRYGVSLSRIGRAFGVDHTTVMNALKKHGHVPSKASAIGPEHSAEIKRLASEGVPYREIAKMLGYSRTGVLFHADPQAYQMHREKMAVRRKRERELKRVKHG